MQEKFMQENNKIIITTLCENTVAFTDVLAEWGLSILIESAQNTILFDTGYSSTCVHNAGILNKDLAKVNKIVLSHGHKDHSGGLLPVLKSINCDPYGRQKRMIDVIAHPDILQSKYILYNGKAAWAGILANRDVLESSGAVFKFSVAPSWLTDNIVTTGEITMQTDYEDLEKELVVKQGTEFVQDRLADDQALIIKTNKGLVVILGCSHRGIINTLLHAQKITNEKRIYMVLGGTHLFFASAQRIAKTILALKDFDIQKIGVSHCTGLSAAAKLATAFGDNFFFNTVGTCIEIDV
jgi:7,8-dihydropterin-6-yl-methyl-4-(beta-D-ribofuranosyl)aminobenzene 5'-phosphate synthase